MSPEIGWLAEIKHETWQRHFHQLQQQIRATGGFGLGETKDEVIANLREIRRQIMEDVPNVQG